MKHSTLMDTDDLEPIIKPEIKRAENYISSKEKDRLNAENLFKK